MLTVLLCGWFAILMVFAISLIVMLLRNDAVYRYRLALLNQVSTASRDDIYSGRSWRWRYTSFESVTYDDMMSQFWLPLDSFYPDKSFITVGAVDPASR